MSHNVFTADDKEMLNRLIGQLGYADKHFYVDDSQWDAENKILRLITVPYATSTTLDSFIGTTVPYTLKNFAFVLVQEYKEGRKPAPLELISQFPLAREMVTKMGLKCYELAGYEADDILGTLAAMAEAEDVMTYIVTGDRDSLQLITDKTNVVLATNQEPILFDTAAFLEEALDKLGLTRREANEFIVYWLPLMEGNAWNLISFQTQAYTDMAKLTVEPAPDTVIRVFMTWRGLNAPVDIPAQTLTAPVRTGFTLVEWGGAELN